MFRITHFLILAALLCGCPRSDPATPSGPKPAAPGTEPGKEAQAPAESPPTSGPEGLDASPDAEQAIGLMASSKDVVCGKQVDLNTAKVTEVWGDTTYVFCSDACAKTFKENPKAHRGN